MRKFFRKAAVVAGISLAFCFPSFSAETSEKFPVPQRVQPVRYKVNIPNEDKDMLARLIFLEAGVQSYQCKRYVASVVVNRLHSRKWGTSFRDVVYSPGQFSCAYLINSTVPYKCGQPYYEKSYEFRNNWDECFRCLEDIRRNGSYLPGNVLYFSSGSPFNWNGYAVHTVCEGMYFGYLMR